MFRIPLGGKVLRSTKYFIIMSYKREHENTPAQEVLGKQSLPSGHAEWMFFCHSRHAGQASTCERVGPGDRNEHERFHRNISPRGLQT